MLYCERRTIYVGFSREPVIQIVAMDEAAALVQRVGGFLDHAMPRSGVDDRLGKSA